MAALDSVRGKARREIVINVPRQPEPTDFDARVRTPGNQHLAANGVPTKSNKFPKFWKHAAQDIYEAYRGICAYTCRYIMPPGSVDHFRPKLQYPNLAYEWDNYRLASQKANSNKGDVTIVVDPFTVGIGWFEIDFPSCLVKPGADASAAVRNQVMHTIDILKLNDDDGLVQDRCNVMLMLTDGDVSLNFLTTRYPFLALEVIRQNIESQLQSLFKRRSRNR